jgi:broad specificity phosphatase PhoE
MTVDVPLLLARHGETDDNASGLILGRRNPALSELGLEQAARLASSDVTAGVVAIWTSPLMRARQTAAILGQAVGVRPTVLEELAESDRGSWEGDSLQHIARVSPGLHAAFERGDSDFVFPEGESVQSQVARTVKGLDLIAAGPTPALVVAHAGTIRAALIALGRTPPPERELRHGGVMPIRWPVRAET